MIGQSILVLAPHADDEVLGAGGLLAQSTRKGAKAFVWVASSSNYTRADGKEVRRADRLEEAEKAARVLGAILIGETKDAEGNLDEKVGHRALVKVIEDVIRAAQPQVVVIPGPSHHQDHQAVRKAALSAMRGGQRGPSVILSFEYPPSPFVDLPAGRVFVELEQLDMNAKLAAWSCYKSQLGSHMTSLQIENMARMRGLEAKGDGVAELFALERMVLK